MKRITTLALTALLVSGITGCQAEERLEEIEKQQALILEKLTAVEKLLSGTRAAARPQRPQEDYSKVYAPLGNPGYSVGRSQGAAFHWVG